MSLLCFDPKRLPRTLTKKEWKECYRWLRVVSNQISKEMERRMINLAMYGNSHPEAAER